MEDIPKAKGAQEVEPAIIKSCSLNSWNGSLQCWLTLPFLSPIFFFSFSPSGSSEVFGRNVVCERDTGDVTERKDMYVSAPL